MIESQEVITIRDSYWLYIEMGFDLHSYFFNKIKVLSFYNINMRDMIQKFKKSYRKFAVTFLFENLLRIGEGEVGSCVKAVL